MARRKNVKRIDPRYFLHETVNRNDDGSTMEEGCPLEDEGEVVDISAPGTEVQVDDISQLSPEEAFAAGMAAARDAIDQAIGAPDGPPPEGGFSGGGPAAEPAMHETALNENEQLKALIPKVQNNPGENFQKKYARHANRAAGKELDDPWGMFWVKNILSGGAPGE